MAKRNALQLLFVLLALDLSFSAFGNRAYGAEIWLKPGGDVSMTAADVAPGDVVVIANGDWHDTEFVFAGMRGTVEAPITIRAEQPGKVLLHGRSSFQLSGRHVTVKGLMFNNSTGTKEVFQFRTAADELAENCRLSDCIFVAGTALSSEGESKWVSIYGHRNRMDHCYLIGKKNQGATVVVWARDGLGQHRIDHNHFGFRLFLGKNGAETLRIGTSETSNVCCQTVVEHNLFHRCNGEAEVISNKCSENIYRGNVFRECSGALTLRHGDRCQVQGNVFLGNGARGTAGVRVIGSGHEITNNYFEGLRGDAERAAICLMNGIVNGLANGYQQVRDLVVANNTLIDCKVSFEIGVGSSTEKPAAAEGVFHHNLVAPGKWEMARVHSRDHKLNWENNRVVDKSNRFSVEWGFECVEIQMERSDDLLIRPVQISQLESGDESEVSTDIDGVPRGHRGLVGCDDPSGPLKAWPAVASTGPTWKGYPALEREP